MKDYRSVKCMPKCYARLTWQARATPWQTSFHRPILPRSNGCNDDACKSNASSTQLTIKNGASASLNWTTCLSRASCSIGTSSVPEMMSWEGRWAE